MRTMLTALLCGALTAAGTAARAEDASARAVVERAIKAHGGAEGLARWQVSIRSGTGKLAPADNQAFNTEAVVDLPERVRLNLEVGKTPIVVVLNGDKGWQRAGGATMDLSKERLGEMREAAYIWWLATLVPLLKGDFELAAQPDARVDGRETAVVKVSSKGHSDALLYFDKGTGLLARISHQTTEAGVPVKKEYTYSDYKEFDGVKLPLREVLSMGGRTWHDVKLSSYKFLPKADDSAFTKP
jgi:hypothetical protein